MTQPLPARSRRRWATRDSSLEPAGALARGPGSRCRARPCSPRAWRWAWKNPTFCSGPSDRRRLFIFIFLRLRSPCGGVFVGCTFGRLVRPVKGRSGRRRKCRRYESRCPHVVLSRELNIYYYYYLVFFGQCKLWKMCQKESEGGRQREGFWAHATCRAWKGRGGGRELMADIVVDVTRTSGRHCATRDVQRVAFVVRHAVLLCAPEGW